MFKEATCAAGEAKCSRELSVLKRKLGVRAKWSKMCKTFWEAKPPKEKSVLRSKVCVSRWSS